MEVSNQEIKVYVSKIETEIGEGLVISSNFNKFKDFCIGGIPISAQINDEEYVENIKDHMIKFFTVMMPNLEKFGVKFNVKYFFNREYSAEGQLLYYYDNISHDNNPRYFKEVYWVNLKKPLTPKEIELFVKALRGIPDFSR